MGSHHGVCRATGCQGESGHSRMSGDIDSSVAHAPDAMDRLQDGTRRQRSLSRRRLPHPFGRVFAGCAWDNFGLDHRSQGRGTRHPRGSAIPRRPSGRVSVDCHTLARNVRKVPAGGAAEPKSPKAIDVGETGCARYLDTKMDSEY